LFVRLGGSRGPIPRRSNVEAAFAFEQRGFLAGELRASERSGRHPRQARSLYRRSTRADQLQRDLFRTPAKPEKAVGDYCFELTGGDLLYGSLLALNAKEAEIRRCRRRPIARATGPSQRFSRWQGDGGLVYSGLMDG